MKKVILFFVFAGFSIGMQAEEISYVKSRIHSIGLFKNGLAVINQTLHVPKTGKYSVEEVFDPVHGTFWIDSNALVKARLTKREYSVDGIKPMMSLEESFGGREVIIHLKDPNPTTIKGKILKFEARKEKKKWDRTYRQSYYYYLGTQYNKGSKKISPRYLRLKTKNGVVYVEPSLIAFIESSGTNNKVKKVKTVLILDVGKIPEKGAKINLCYLTKGISWAPSYRIILKSTKNLSIEQKAVIKNEFTDLENTEIEVISGFPNIKFAHVTSPISLQTSWSSFFQQLNRRFRPTHATLSNVMTQQAFTPTDPPSGSGLDLSAAPGEGVDIHYENIGKISMKEGDSLSIQVKKRESEYERIVEWIIPDTRDQWGRYVEDYQRRQNPEKYQDAAWDSIRFKNPFKFPMTTAVASMYDREKFLGQTLSFWVNPNTETVLHITKALSISTKSTEKEVKGEREKLYIAGRRFQKTQVEGQINVKNHRRKAVKLLVRRKFSGKLISSEGNPRSKLLEIGVYSVNERNELTWEFRMNPGEEKTFKYKYSVLAYY